MVEKKPFGILFDDQKAYALAFHFNMTGMLVSEASAKALACANWIESPDTFKTFTHGLNSQRNKSLEVAWLGGYKDYGDLMRMRM